MNDSWKRHPRKNGDKAMYVNIPSNLIKAMGMSWEEFWTTQIVEFKIQDGKVIIELKR